MNKWIWKNNGQIDYIIIPEWRKKGVLSVFSSRHGGFSKHPYESLNMGLHVNDIYESVIKNRRSFLSIWGYDLKQLVCCQQVHGNRVAVVGKEDAGKGTLIYATALPEVDAMVTNVPGVMLATFYADCIPVYLFDPVNLVVGLAHSGWKGTMGRISQKTLQVMRKQYGSRTEDIEVFIGPGIGSCCYKIQPELAVKVSEEFPEFGGIIREKSFWDLPLTVRLGMEEEGILPANIIDCNLCTSCHKQFFSYRRENGKTGRMAAVIGIES